MALFDKMLFIIVGTMMVIELFRLIMGKQNVYSKIHEWFFKGKKRK